MKLLKDNFLLSISLFTLNYNTRIKFYILTIYFYHFFFYFSVQIYYTVFFFFANNQQVIHFYLISNSIPISNNI